MIYLNAEVISGLGEDTFWTWFMREFPSSSFEIPKKLENRDMLIRYSTLGFLPIKGKQTSLCWELYPEMKAIYNTQQWNHILANVYESAKYSTYRTVPTTYSKKIYLKYGSVNVIPIGVDSKLFKPSKDKKKLRVKYGIKGKKVGIWVGTTHPMKGFEEFLEYKYNHPDIFWILVWKSESESWPVNEDNHLSFTNITQSTLAELFQASDFFLSTNKLSTYFMVEWEAMTANLPIVLANNRYKEFIPPNKPRKFIESMNWTRDKAKKQWEIFLDERGVKW